MVTAEMNMVEQFDCNQLVDMLSKKGLPIVGGKNSAIFCPNKLADVDSSRCVDNLARSVTLECGIACIHPGRSVRMKMYRPISDEGVWHAVIADHYLPL